MKLKPSFGAFSDFAAPAAHTGP